VDQDKEAETAKNGSPVAAASARQTTVEDSGALSDNYDPNLGSGSNMYSLGYRNDFSMPDYYHERAVEVMSTNWISSSYPDTTEFDGQWPQFNFDDATSGLGVPFFFSNTAQVASGSNISCDTLPVGDGDHFSGLLPAHDSPVARPGSMPDPMIQSGIGSTSSPASAASNRSIGKYYVEGDGARAPFNGNRPQSTNEANSANGASTPSMLQSPVARNSSSSTHSQLDVESMVSASCFNSMVQGIQAECGLQSVHIDWSTLPSLQQVRELVGLYYEKFHPIFPFLSRESLVAGSKNDWLLVLASAAVAATYEPSLRTSPMRTTLPFLLRTVIKGHVDKELLHGQGMQWTPSLTERHPSDRRADLAALQAGILNVLCMLRSGDECLMRRVIRENYRLVECCRAMSLLSKSESAVDVDANSHGELRHGPQLSREADIKTGMMIWVRIHHSSTCRASTNKIV
jgi:hypothetical protein